MTRPIPTPNFPPTRIGVTRPGKRGCVSADAADVKTLVIFHHDPGHDDDFMDKVAAEAAAARPGTLVAQEVRYCGRDKLLAGLPGRGCLIGFSSKLRLRNTSRL